MIGTTIQNYTIHSLLGEGGMGSVYLATDELLGRTVAIKNLNTSLTSQPQFLERFKNEAKTLARLSHPHIAMLYNYLQNADNYYMVMEYVEGENLDELLKKHRTLPAETVVSIAIQALQGLDHAHKKGILHRDIKPANLMLTTDHTIKLMDFGIAKVSDSAKLTQASRVIGTIEFLAPELIEGKEPAAASDIYAMGVMMYELLTGQLPFTGKSDYMLMQDIMKQKPMNLQKLNAGVPKSISEIVLKALEKKPEKRFVSAAAFLQALTTAFPHVKEVYIPSLIKNKVPPATIVAGTHRPSSYASTGAPQHTTPATEAIRIDNGGKGKYTPNWKWYIIAATVFVAALLTYVFWPSQEKPTAENMQQEVANDITHTEKPIAEEPTKANQDSIQQIIDNNKKPQPIVDNATGTTNGSNARHPNKVKDDKNETATQKPQPVVTTEKPTPQPSEVPAPDIKEPVKLRVSVMLSLIENLTPTTAQEGQNVSFKVREPVIVKGTTVIPQGAVIRASIKGIGSKRIALIFHSIAAKGRNITLEKSEAGGWKDEVLSQGNVFKTGLRGTLIP